MKTIVLLINCMIPCFVLASDQSPYAGEELRPLKSLSVNEIESLRRGDGMGFAKLAELNHFPGPKHVLDISDHLDLSSQQLTDTVSLFESMRRDAVAIGEKLLTAESRLDEEFERQSIDPESLETALLEIGRLRARLRFVHLNAHLAQAKLLRPEQIRRYDSVRGYHNAQSDHSEQKNRHH